MTDEKIVYYEWRDTWIHSEQFDSYIEEDHDRRIELEITEADDAEWSGSLHSRKGAKAKGPLRLITGIARYAGGMFDVALVDLECGHSGVSYADSPLVGTTRARCAECGKQETK